MKRRKGFALILAFLLLFSLPGKAELPGSLYAIEEEAFSNSALKSAVVPWGTAEIGDRAFSGCENLSRIVIPPTVEIMGRDCLKDCARDLLIVTEKGSAAMRWAEENSVDFQAGTRYRALLIGQTYRNCSLYPALYGPPNDVEAMALCLSRLDGAAYETTTAADLTADRILSAIQASFGGAEEQDVSLFYYSGHGYDSASAALRGALVGADGTDFVTAGQLRAALDAIPGRKIVIIDACYSGNFIGGMENGPAARGAAETPENGAEAFLAAFAAAFSRQSRAGGYSRYFLLAGAAENEETFEDRVGGRIMGLFTASLTAGLGWDPAAARPGAYLADENRNGVVTFREAYAYTRQAMIWEGQHVQAYPSACDWLALARLAAEAP